MRLFGLRHFAARVFRLWFFGGGGAPAAVNPQPAALCGLADRTAVAGVADRTGPVCDPIDRTAFWGY